MNKTLKYVPIYKGEFNMTKEEYDQQIKATQYSQKVNRESDFTNEAIKTLIMFGSAIALSLAAIL